MKECESPDGSALYGFNAVRGLVTRNSVLEQQAPDGEGTQAYNI